MFQRLAIYGNVCSGMRRLKERATRARCQRWRRQRQSLPRAQDRGAVS